MKFVRVPGWDECVEVLSKRLIHELKKHDRVLWLICGGSNIEAEVRIMESLPDDLTHKLAIFMTDERYGDVGHVHSNAKQLHDAGFQAKQAIFVPMLEPGFSIDETQERYSQALERAFEHADVVIAQFGIGADGHIAGILPNSLAVSASAWITAYEAPHYTRMTLTFEALRHIDAAYALVMGKDKIAALERLRDEDVSLQEQPSQILKQLPEAFIYNDQIGDN
jgi:6-phosphogluconolactonase/glucosamine-6-phosphate isomerase/deaminase